MRFKIESKEIVFAPIDLNITIENLDELIYLLTILNRNAYSELQGTCPYINYNKPTLDEVNGLVDKITELREKLDYYARKFGLKRWGVIK